MNKLNAIPLYSALSKPNLFMGAERELIMMLALISLTMIFVALSLQSLILGVAIWFIVSFFLRSMAKSDPIMSKIYVQQLKYQKFYPAHSTPFTRID